MTFHAPRRGIVAGLIALGAVTGAPQPAFAASPAPPSASPSSPGPATPRTTLVHRCIETGGRTRYSQLPCPASSAASTVRLGDAPTQAQMKQGHEIQARMRKLDRAMQQDRQRLERDGARRMAASLTVPAREASAGKAKGKATSAGRAADRKAAGATARKPVFTARVPRQEGESPRRTGKAP